ncbi:hypothetical protein OMO22_001115 [Salmonella enterica]|nr:hypothetical protein [Salmonella enterica]EKA8748951.1 hypothetical protein [Salmonella enterica]
MKKKKIMTPLFTAVSLSLISVSPAVLAAGSGIGTMTVPVFRLSVVSPDRAQPVDE